MNKTNNGNKKPDEEPEDFMEGVWRAMEQVPEDFMEMIRKIGDQAMEEVGERLKEVQAKQIKSSTPDNRPETYWDGRGLVPRSTYLSGCYQQSGWFFFCWPAAAFYSCECIHDEE